MAYSLKSGKAMKRRIKRFFCALADIIDTVRWAVRERRLAKKYGKFQPPE